MTCFRRRNGSGYGFYIPHFAEHNHVRCLAQGRTQCTGKARCVSGNFPLTDNALLVRMQILDGVFNGNNMAAAGCVNLVYQAGQRGTFTVAGRSRYKNHAAPQISKPHNHIRNIIGFRIRNAERDNTAGHRKGAPLTIRIAAETAQVTYGE